MADSLKTLEEFKAIQSRVAASITEPHQIAISKHSTKRSAGSITSAVSLTGKLCEHVENLPISNSYTRAAVDPRKKPIAPVSSISVIVLKSNVIDYRMP
jgi:hypothetical protein